MRRGLLAAAALAIAGAASVAHATLIVSGAGATLPYALYSRWFTEFSKSHPDLKFDYQPVGSGAGIQQIGQRAIDFGATDAPMTDEQIDQSPAVVHIPAALGAVAVVYNLPAAPAAGIRLGGTVLADIFLGRIATWNDARILAQNPGVKLPEVPITIVYRADRSGTTFVFTDYLAKVSPEWRSKVGSSMSIQWPMGLGIKGGEGAIGLIKGTPGAIGYAEFAAANRHRLGIAAIGNAEGEYVRPSFSSAAAAAANMGTGGDFRVLLTNAPGSDSYPLVAFTYLLVAPDQPDVQRGRALLQFLWWAIHDGQQYTTQLGFVPLPRNVVSRLEPTLRSLTVQGRPIHLGP